MSNVLLWFPRVALHDCTIEGELLNSFEDINKIYGFIKSSLTIGGLLSSVSPAFMTMLLTILVAITGYEIKKGWHINIDATCVHYDPDLYNDPLKFNPQRFDVASSLSLSLSFWPFYFLECSLLYPRVKIYFT